jgi:hypothetical protein
MELKYRPQVTGGAGFGVGGSGSLQVIDWGDSSAFEQYEYFTGAFNYQTHTYTAMVGYRTATVFHNNDIGTLIFIESGSFYPAVVKLVSILGDLPDGLNTILVGNCLALGIDNSNIAQIDLTNCPLIYWIQIASCTSLLVVDTA